MRAGRTEELERRSRFEDLAAEVYEPVQRYVRRRVAADAVDDVVSDVMLTLWRRLEYVPPNARLPWSYGVARRSVANHRRAAGRHLRLVRRMEAQPLAAQPRSPMASDVPLDAELEIALDGLSEGDRELLHLWAWEQLEPAEIGVVLGLTPNAVSIRLHRAKNKLRENLETARKNEAASGHSHLERRKEDES